MSISDPVAPTHFPTLFSPFTIGRLTLRNRVIMPPHSSAIGNIWGTDEEAARAFAYVQSRAEGGVSWTTIPGRIANVLIPGFEPSGVSAEVRGYFRLPIYQERMRAYVDAVHSAGAYATQQLTMIGGFPHGPSAKHTSPISNMQPHVLNTDEIARFVEEYGFSAGQAKEAGIDIIELHANHDDLQEWFLSPLTNAREDRYGGDIEGRTRFLIETITAVRAAFGDKTIGVRMNMMQEDPGGLDIEGALNIARIIESSGLVDYLHLVAGSPWGNPSYIQPMWFPEGGWSSIAGRFRESLNLPIVHTGRIISPEMADRIVSNGEADVVGIARALVADPEFLIKAREGNSDRIRPCIGGNDCINRRYVDGLPFGCAVNPHSSREVELPWRSRRMTDRLTIVGGGPAGMELAALCAEAGAEVTLHERSSQLGGQLTLAMAAPQQVKISDYVTWQTRRLHDLGVTVRLNSEITVEDIKRLPPDSRIAIATGATSRIPDVPGVDRAEVLDSWKILTGEAQPGSKVLVVAEDDHLPPLQLADFLVKRGHEVTVVYSTPTAAVLLGRYIVGSIMGELDRAGVEFRYLEKFSAVTPKGPEFRHIYSGRTRVYEGFDSIALSCGGVSDTSLFDQIRQVRPDAHILGDAYAPRRLVFATRQAYALAEILTEPIG